ncbi:class I SAM-dependent methyltransferase [Tsukamurella sp. 8F]|uniref:class I SAM-dependent methyltransferase n=1 Tax=unclassified Tsukamurella TaxID=2633480 RepID=UPI0023B9D605|nr:MULTISPECIES: class I SAM-dependent methyltransferase [unclassified Tsukamurella]MDF0528802.1 class I SAM-dependent methyltransferase [Tsukamurella sp. 8J]MDF0586637.1 class I SAM-dependent methyltransferase [Tsukamurella sp. 8F]
MRAGDGSAGDADYARIGRGYSTYRRPEPFLRAAIEHALGDARTVINVGAGAGSYEPTAIDVTAVEPSASMRRQRPTRLPTAVDAVAEELPFADASFDAAIATFTVHQWADLDRGLSEMRRVATGPVVIMTCDPARVHDFWLDDYAPEVLETEARRYPGLDRISDALGGSAAVTPLPIPRDCRDGFSEAYYGRPEMFLEPGARLANSAWSFVDEAVTDRAITALRSDLASGAWDERHGHLREQSTYAGSLVLITGSP